MANEIEEKIRAAHGLDVEKSKDEVKPVSDGVNEDNVIDL